jgi:serine protease
MKKINALLTFSLAASMCMAQGNKVYHYNPLNSGKYFTMPNVQSDEYLAKTIIFQVKDQYRANCSTSNIENLMPLNSFLIELGATTVQKIYPNHQPPDKKFNELGQKYADLSLIYKVVYTGDAMLEKAINKLYSMGYFEYVEPWYVPKITLQTNDPSATSGTQYHLYITKCAATGTSGWNIQTGNSNVVIGITDTGTEPNHPDLIGNIKHNAADPIDGVDNDLDGYIDNYSGWDVGDVSVNPNGDNDPTWQGNNHGCAVSGDACESTNNSIGGGAPGYNCKFLPVKIADATGALVAAYQGITYAADHGANIINCSWGSAGAGTYEQTVIDYATINKNCLVVAAAGNNSADQKFYPAALNYVISVAATGPTDVKASFSNWNSTVDVSSPGLSIYATTSGTGYGTNSGTSMASPVAAGICGIIKAQYPSYTGLQVGEMLKSTADVSVYTSNPQPQFAGKLGTGRVNCYTAVTTPGAKSVVFNNMAVTDNNDGIFVGNDTMRITGTYINYLAPTTSACTATLSTSSPYVTILNGTFNIGALATLGTINNNSSPFKVKVLTSAPINSVITFTMTITDGPYSVTSTFDITVNVDYINVTVNDIQTTITSKGRIGYNLDGQQQGLGFVYMDSSMMYESSMMIGTSSTKVSDMFRGSGTTGDVDNSSLVRVSIVNPTVFSDFDLDGTFRDNLSTSPIGVTTHHKTFAWSTNPNRKYVIVEYTVKNTNTSAINNMWVGVISDWDVTSATYGKDKANQDVSRKMGYVYCTNTNGQYAGIKVLTQTPFNHYGIDNVTGGGGGIDATAGTPEFDTGEKYTVLSTSRPTAGNTQTQGNDVMSCVSSGPFTVAAGDSIKVAFALLGGDNLSQLQTSADDAQVMYDGLTNVVQTSDVSNEFGLNCYPNPAVEGSSYVQFFVDKAAEGELKVFDVMGKEIVTVEKGMMQAGKHEFWLDVSKLSSGIYFYQLNVGGKTVTRKMIVNN